MAYNVFYSSISLVLSFGILLVAVLAKNIVGTWINPSSIFSGFWFLFSIVPIILGWGIPINPAAVLYILLFLVTFSFTALLFPWKNAFYLNKEKSRAADIFDSKYLFYVLLAISISITVFFVIDLRFQGLNISTNLFGISAQYAGLHYSGELVQNAYIKIATILSFPCVAIAGLLGTSTPNRMRRVVSIFLGFTPSIFLIFFQGAKGSLFFSAALFFGSYLVVKIYNGEFSVFSGKFIVRTIFTMLVVIIFVTISFVTRGGGDEGDFDAMLSHLKYSFLSYSSGHLFAFSDWFTDRYFYASNLDFRQEEWTLGFYTFMSIFQFAGDDRFVPLGVYDEYFDHAGMLTTNIYTVFRGLISDFSLVGSFVFALFFGFLCNAIFYNLLSKRFSFFSIAFFIFSVAIFYQSYIVSSLTWLSIPVSFFLLSIILLLCGRQGWSGYKLLKINYVD